MNCLLIKNIYPKLMYYLFGFDSTEIELNLSLSRGLKLKLIGGPHSKGDMLRGPQFDEKSFCGP
jgi:hypothetical protein